MNVYGIFAWKTEAVTPPSTGGASDVYMITKTDHAHAAESKSLVMGTFQYGIFLMSQLISNPRRL